MRFEKWQALGNDYVILEQSEAALELTPERIRRVCAPHSGVGSDGILLLSPPEGPDAVARLRIFNPDGSEAELSGNGAREAVLYLRRRGWTEQDSFSLETAAGEVRPHITGRDTCSMAMGTARLASGAYPGGPPDGSGSVTVDGRRFDFQHVSVGNPQCAIEVHEGLEELDLGEVGPPIEGSELFPERTNVSFWRREGPHAVRARIFERGVGETLSSGTGATGAAVAAVVRGAVESAVTVRLDGGELEVEVAEDLAVRLTGWAVPVYAGTLSEELVGELEAIA